jgi:hypothetical protein
MRRSSLVIFEGGDDLIKLITKVVMEKAEGTRWFTTLCQAVAIDNVVRKADLYIPAIGTVGNV